MAPKNVVTLAEGDDRWEVFPNGSRRYRTEGEVWLLAWDEKTDQQKIVLKPEIAQWCADEIGAYRLVNHRPVRGEDAWRIEFETDKDAVHFKLRWMG